METADVLRKLGDLMSIERKQIDRALAAQKAKFPDSHPRYWGFIDFGRPSKSKRFVVMDTRGQTAQAYLCAHGKGSDLDNNGMLDRFSNEPGSNATSEGVYRCAEPRQCDKHGLELLMDGLDASNSNVRSRAIVLHKAEYVNDTMARELGRIGRSWGCFAVDVRVHKELIDQLKNGSFIVAYK